MRNVWNLIWRQGNKVKLRLVNDCLTTLKDVNIGQNTCKIIECWKNSRSRNSNLENITAMQLEVHKNTLKFLHAFICLVLLSSLSFIGKSNASQNHSINRLFYVLFVCLRRWRKTFDVKMKHIARYSETSEVVIVCGRVLLTITTNESFISQTEYWKVQSVYQAIVKPTQLSISKSAFIHRNPFVNIRILWVNSKHSLLRFNGVDDLVTLLISPFFNQSQKTKLIIEL